MSSIDEAIAKGKKRRKGMAIASLIGLAVILALYFSWLFPVSYTHLTLPTSELV